MPEESAKEKGALYEPTQARRIPVIQASRSVCSEEVMGIY